MTSTPIYHNGTFSFVKHRPKLATATEYGNAASFWVEYPSGLLDLTRTTHLPTSQAGHAKPAEEDHQLVHEDPAVRPPPPLVAETQWELAVEYDRVLRLNKAHSAIVIIDMQKYDMYRAPSSHPSD